jgi:RNA ligase
MNFYKSLGLTHEEFAEKYENTGLVERRHHDTFPLDLLCYSRKCVHENVWDKATSLCRGIIITRGQDGGEIIARPFEKFHNYGAIVGEYAGAGGPQAAGAFGEPVVWEKMDGFMCTLYRYANKDYIASKGSFHSIHAKWATAQIRAKFGDRLPIVLGSKTLVFEGLHRDLRIVIDYKERQELVLLAVIDNETGEEYSPENLETIARVLGFNTPLNFELTLEQARATSLGDGKCDEEGYVLTWYRDGVPPFRLKMKFIEYLRLHRMVTGVSPKRIWEVLSTNQSSELDEYLKQSTPWFSKFVQKWINAMRAEYDRLHGEAHTRFQCAQIMLKDDSQRNWDKPHSIRKAYAERFTTPENKEFSSILFAMLDGKQIAPVIWKMVRRMTHGANPMVDAHNT